MGAGLVRRRLGLPAWTGFRGNDRPQMVSGFGTVLQQLVSLLIIYMGAILVIAGEISIGALIAANLLASRALAPMRQVVSAWTQLQEVRPAFHRLDDITAAETEINPGGFAPAPTLPRRISCHGDPLPYAADQSPALPHTSRPLLPFLQTLCKTWPLINTLFSWFV